MKCPHCQSDQTGKNGTATLQDQSLQQRYLCRACEKRFNERTNTPMARLRTPSTVVSAAINVRTEGLGVRATGRSFGKSHATIILWERRLAAQVSQGRGKGAFLRGAGGRTPWMNPGASSKDVLYLVAIELGTNFERRIHG